MGISIYDIPEIGDLTPVRRRELARWLRTLVPTGQQRPLSAIRQGLVESVFNAVPVERLLELGWLSLEGDSVHADTYARRIAAGAVDGQRMSVEESLELALTVTDRAQKWAAAGPSEVQLLRVVLYGSAVRDTGNLSDTVGDLDLALELAVSGNLSSEVSALPATQRWRAAVERSGLGAHLMQGDDRITLAGSLAKVLALFNRQLHGLDVPSDGRQPSAVVLWTAADRHLSVELERPALLPEALACETEPCSAELLRTLAFLQSRSIATHSRAKSLAEHLGLREGAL